MNDIEFNQNKTILPFLKRMYRYTLLHEKKRLVLLVIFAGIVGTIDSFYPFIFSGFINECLSGNMGNTKLPYLDIFLSPCMFRYFLYLLGACVGISVSVAIFVYAAGSIGERVIYQLRREIFEKLQRLPFAYYDQNSSGWLLSRISSDTDRVAEVISWGLIGIAWAIVSIFFCFGIMLYMNWKMTLIVLISIPLMIVISAKIRAKILSYSRISRKINSEMIGLITEHINGVELNKVLANESKAVSIFSEKAEQHRKASCKSAFYSATYFPIVIVVGNMAAAGVLIYGANLVLEKSTLISLGILSSFFIYAIQIFEPIADISNYYSIAQNCLSAGERIFSLLDEPLALEDELHKANFESIQGNIELKNIQFGYNESKMILQDFNLKIPSGQQVAIVGPTGEGKSTIASIIARFYLPSAGHILIDGIDVNDRTMESYRQQVGVVLQQPHVFSGTIADNVRFGKSNMTDVEISQIFTEMGCIEMASRMNEEIKPDGINLSVGEKQLIAIARVFAYNPKILILDEATSAIDTITEQRLQMAIQRVLKNRTSLVIAHRLSTIVESDRILYIQSGKIIEDGNHASLMKMKGEYWKLNQVS